jgi:hypothetical protein
LWIRFVRAKKVPLDRLHGQPLDVEAAIPKQADLLGDDLRDASPLSGRADHPDPVLAQQRERRGGHRLHVSDGLRKVRLLGVVFEPTGSSIITSFMTAPDDARQW